MTDPAGPTGPGTRPADPHYDHSSGAAALRGEVYRPPEYLEYLEKAAAALKVVRLIVYAGMTSFVILALYGFLLIYRLTNDVHSAVLQTRLMTQQMQAMTLSMANMNQSITGMSSDITTMNGSVFDISKNVGAMSSDVTRMAEAVTLMQHSARNIDQSVGPVMGAVNRFVPFGWPGSNYGGAPPYAR